MMTIVKQCLQQLIDAIDDGKFHLNDEQCEMIMMHIGFLANAESKFSKYQACEYLKLPRSTFDAHVAAGKIPRGRQQPGFKEIFWLKKDLDKFRNILLK